MFVALLIAMLRCSPDETVTETEAPRDLTVDEDEASRLRALGYASVSGDSSQAVGVVHHDPNASQPGLNLFTNAHGCSAQLVSAAGAVLRSWSHEPCQMWGNTILLADGGLLVVHQSPRLDRVPKRRREEFEGTPASELRDLLRFDATGQLLWERRAPVHHDVELTPDGRIATLTYAHRLVPDIHPQAPVKDHAVAIFDTDGSLLDQLWLLDLLRTAPKPFALKPIEAHWSRPEGIDEVDLIHANSIEWMRWTGLFDSGPLYGPSHFVMSLRNQDTVLIADWKTRRVLWTWGQGQISGPHDATLLRNGNVLVFDNGLGRGWSRVVEVDPRTDELVWEYRAPEGETFFSATRGAAQRLANGNTLITDSERGRVFEVTPSGEVVWDFRNPNRDGEGKPYIIVRMRRLPEPLTPDGPFTWSD